MTKFSTEKSCRQYAKKLLSKKSFNGLDEFEQLSTIILLGSTLVTRSTPEFQRKGKRKTAMFEEFIRLCLNGEVNLAIEHKFLKRPPRIQKKGNRVMSNHDDLLMSSMVKSQEFRKRRELLYQAESEDTIECLGYCDYSRYQIQTDGIDDVYQKLHPKSRSSQSLPKVSEETDQRFSSLEDSKTLHGSRNLSSRDHSQNVSGTFESRLEQQQALQRQQMIAFLSAIHFESLQQTQEKTSKPEGLSSKSKLCKMLESLFNSFHLKTIRSRILR